MAINFDFRSGAKKSGHLDYPLQSYGPKQVIKNHAWWWLVKIFKFRWFLGPSAIKKSRLFAQPSYLSTLKPIKHFSGSFNFFPKVSRDTSQWAHCVLWQLQPANCFQTLLSTDRLIVEDRVVTWDSKSNKLVASSLIFLPRKSKSRWNDIWCYARDILPIQCESARWIHFDF